jgi:hypothetical protein
VSTPNSAIERNHATARRINAEVAGNPQSPYAGKFVGIVDGQITAVANDLSGLVERLRESGIDFSRAMLMEVGVDHDLPVEIWVVG